MKINITPRVRGRLLRMDIEIDGRNHTLFYASEDSRFGLHVALQNLAYKVSDQCGEVICTPLAQSILVAEMERAEAQEVEKEV